MADKKKKDEHLTESTKSEASISQDSTQQSNQEKIAERAYVLFEERGQSHGSDMDDWLQAEQELLKRKQ